MKIGENTGAIQETDIVSSSRFGLQAARLKKKHFGHFSVMLSSIIFNGYKIKDSSALESFVCFFPVFLSVSISTPYTNAKTKNDIKFNLIRKLLQ